jgi:hypothetical protein
MLAGVDAQTSKVRRRLNRVALEHALFAAAGTVLLSFAVLAPLAFLLSPRGFAWATWLTFAGVAATVVVLLRSVRTSWVSGAAAAVIIDHRAGLEDRLATLVTADADARSSRLWNFLLRENLRLLPSWAPRRLVPRSLPKSVWYFVCSLLVAALVSHRIPRFGPWSPPPEPSDPVVAMRGGASEAASAAETGQVAEAARSWRDLPERLRQAILGSQSSRTFAGPIPPRTAPVTEDKGGPAVAGSRIENSGPLRSVPATAETARLAGPPSAGRSTAQAPGNRQQAAESQPASAAPPARGDPPQGPSFELGELRGDRPRSLARGPVGGAGGGAGAGRGGDRAGLFGERQESSRTAGSFPLDLDALRGGESNQEGEDGEPGARVKAPLSPQQRLDDTVRRAQVPAEYEKIVQRIFNRGMEDAERAAIREQGADGGTR